MRRVIVPLVCAGALLVGACSHGSGSAGTATTSPTGAEHAATSTTTAAARTAGEHSADERIAARAALRRRDLPGRAWASVPLPDDRETSFVRLCKPLARARARAEAAQGSELPSAQVAFVQGDRALPLVRSRVYVVRDEQLASRVFAMLGSRAYARCIADAFVDPRPRQPGVSYGKATVRVGAVRTGDESSRFLVTVPTTSQGATFDTRLDIVVVRRGRAVNLALFADASLLPLPETTKLAVIRAATRRLQVS